MLEIHHNSELLDSCIGPIGQTQTLLRYYPGGSFLDKLEKILTLVVAIPLPHFQCLGNMIQTKSALSGRGEVSNFDVV